MRWIKDFLTIEDGATAVEYAVMLALVLMALIGTLGTLGAKSGGMWGSIDTNLQTHGLGS